MEQINYFKEIRGYLDKITSISNKLASNITEIDLAKLDVYACHIWGLTDALESEMKEVE